MQLAGCELLRSSSTGRHSFRHVVGVCGARRTADERADEGDELGDAHDVDAEGRGAQLA